MVKHLLLSVALILLMSSCATIFSGQYDEITFKSDPEGAMVYINGIEQCRTPCTTRVKRSIPVTKAELRLRGYETRHIELSSRFNLVSLWNIFCTPLGWVVDAISGSISEYDQHLYMIELEPKDIAARQATAISIDTTEKTITYIYLAEDLAQKKENNV